MDRYIMTSETPFEMKRVISKHLRNLTSDGRWNTRRKKDLARYTSYRVLRAAGLTHDNQQEEVDRRGFVTPLTELQDTSTLPRSPLHRRFLFPHTLSYKVYWGPPSVEEEPNKYEGSMVGCSVAARLQDLPLTQQQKERLVDIVGPGRVDEVTGVVVLEADVFPDRNHNAALLGDMWEKLLREAARPREAPLAAAEAPAEAAASEPRRRGSGGGGGSAEPKAQARTASGGGGRRPAAPRGEGAG